MFKTLYFIISWIIRTAMTYRDSDGGPRGVWLYSHPWGVGEAGEPIQRCNPSNGITIHR